MRVYRYSNGDELPPVPIEEDTYIMMSNFAMGTALWGEMHPYNRAQITQAMSQRYPDSEVKLASKGVIVKKAREG